MGSLTTCMDFWRPSQEVHGSAKAPMAEAPWRDETGCMTLIETKTAAGSPVLPNTLRLGAVHLTVADLDRAVAWYQRALGLRVHAHEIAHRRARRRHRDRRRAARGPAGPARRPPRRPLPLRAAVPEPRGARPRRGPPGARPRTPIQGASDHGTHEAIYLPDADGNGIELAGTATASSGRPASATPAARPRWTSTACWPPSRASRRPTTSARACAWATCTCTSATSTGRWPSTATCSASRCRRTSARPRSSPPAATTTTSASTSGTAAASTPAAAHRRPAPLDRAAAHRRRRRRAPRARRGRRPGGRAGRRRLRGPRPLGHGAGRRLDESDRIGPRQGRRRSHERAAERPRTQARLARGRGARPGRPPPLRARQLAAGRRPIEP